MSRPAQRRSATRWCSLCMGHVLWSTHVNTNVEVGSTCSTLWSCSLFLAELQALKVSWLLAEALPCRLGGGMPCQGQWASRPCAI